MRGLRVTERLVIIGAGMASARLLERLTEADGDYDITIFNAEPRGAYNRIMLSPVLAGDKSFSDIVTHDEGWYASRGITTRFCERVEAIDTAEKTVTGAKGAVPYDRLVIATGSTPVTIPLPGHALPGVIAYRDQEDTQIMMDLPNGGRAVVIGGGLLGLEAAAGMAAQGAKVTVVHLMDHLMERQLDKEAAALLQASLEAKGIEVLCGAQSEAIVGNTRVEALRLKDGRELPCDLLVMAVGIRPAVRLAKEAGLKVNKAIEVDDQLVTSDPSVYALGECTEHRGSLFGLVAPLYDQAEVLAETLLGRDAAFTQKALATKLKVTGCDLFSAGDFADGEGRESITLRLDGSYRRLILERGRLVGAVIYGDTGDGPWFFDLIQEGREVSALRETLIFGPAYAEALDAPRSSLAA